jgi:hypothetical protein
MANESRATTNGNAQTQTLAVDDHNARVDRILAQAEVRRYALEPKDLREAREVAEAFAASGMFGAATRAEFLLAKIMTGRELGLTAMASVRGIYAFETKGRLLIGVDASLVVALVQRHPDVEYFECIETDAKHATWEIKKRGRPAQKYSYTMEMAATAGLTNKDNWRQNPDAMLRARAASALARIAVPGALLNVYSADEVRDIEHSERGEPVHNHDAENEELAPVREDLGMLKDFTPATAAEIYCKHKPDLSMEDAAAAFNLIFKAIHPEISKLQFQGWIAAEEARRSPEPPESDGVAWLEWSYAFAESPADIAALNLRATALKLTKGSPEYKRLAAALKIATMRLATPAKPEPTPPDDGPSDTKPTASNDAPEHDEERAAIIAESAAPVASARPTTAPGGTTPSALAESARSQSAATVHAPASSPDAAWRAHLATKINAFDVANSYAKHAHAGSEYGSIESMQAIALERLAAIEPHAGQASAYAMLKNAWQQKHERDKRAATKAA